MVVALGQAHNLVGVSHSCDLPAALEHLPRLTSTTVPLQRSSEQIDHFVRDHLETRSALYELNLDALARAAPQVIVSQGLCDVCAVATGDVLAAIEALPGNPILVDLNPNTLADILDDLERVGAALELQQEASIIRAALQQRIDYVAERNQRVMAADRPRVAFLEWLDPLFNGGHWNPEIVELAGASEVFGSPAQASATRSIDQLAACDPDILLVACCGYRPQQTLSDLNSLRSNPNWCQLRAVKNNRVFIADGQDYFARPSPSIVDALERLAVTLHPTTCAGLTAEPFQRIPPSDNSL